MPGVRGRSGRKSWDKEQDGKKLWDKAVPIVLGYLNNQHVDEKDKVRVAVELIKKMTPSQLQNTHHVTLEDLVAGSFNVESIEGRRTNDNAGLDPPDHNF